MEPKTVSPRTGGNPARGFGIPTVGIFHPRRHALAAAALAASLALAGAASAGAAERLERRKVTLSLPGAPAKIVAADIDRNGSQDLLVIVVYTEYEEISFDHIEGFVQLTEIVPALSERREARAYLAGEGGVYRPAGEPLPLPAEVAAIGRGTPEHPLLALLPDGVSELRLRPGPGEGASLEFVPLISADSVLRGARTFLPKMELVADLDGSGTMDVLFPGADGFEVFRGGEEGALLPASSARLRLPGDRTVSWPSLSRWYPVPAARDLNGDGRAELVLAGEPGRALRPSVLTGLGDGRFGPPEEIDLRCLDRAAKRRDVELVFVGDLDGRGAGEIVLRREVDTGHDGLHEAKEPKFVYLFHRLRPDLAVEPAPYQELEVTGYALGELLSEGAGTPFRDLDGDGRLDLVTVTLDFSIFQVMRVLTTKRIGIGLDFNVWSQKTSGIFERVEGLRLSDKILLDLNDLRLDRLGNFAGDFDGDGRREFLAYQGGRKLELRHGAEGCAYSRKPDMELVLDEEPQDPRLVEIQDLDGDGSSDLAVTRIREAGVAGATPPVLLDLYLSGGGR